MMFVTQLNQDTRVLYVIWGWCQAEINANLHFTISVIYVEIREWRCQLGTVIAHNLSKLACFDNDKSLTIITCFREKVAEMQ